MPRKRRTAPAAQPQKSSALYFYNSLLLASSIAARRLACIRGPGRIRGTLRPYVGRLPWTARLRQPALRQRLHRAINRDMYVSVRVFAGTAQPFFFRAAEE